VLQYEEISRRLVLSQAEIYYLEKALYEREKDLLVSPEVMLLVELSAIVRDMSSSEDSLQMWYGSFMLFQREHCFATIASKSVILPISLRKHCAAFGGSHCSALPMLKLHTLKEPTKVLILSPHQSNQHGLNATTPLFP
jgi:hypothetical protein